MRPTQTEISDNLVGEHRNGYIDTGSYTVITSSSIIRGFIVQNPKRGPYQNEQDTYLQYSINNALANKWYTIARGDRKSVGVQPDNNTIYLTSNTNGAGYELVLALEKEGYSND